MDNVSSIFLIMLKSLYHISRYTMRDVIRFGQSIFNFDTDDDDLDGIGCTFLSPLPFPYSKRVSGTSCYLCNCDCHSVHLVPRAECFAFEVNRDRTVGEE